MAYVSHPHRVVFFAAPATGSTATIAALKQRQIGEYWPPRDIIKDGRCITPRKHSTLRQLKDGGIYEPIADYTKVVGTRNVFSWLVSKYVRNKTMRLKAIADPKSWVYEMPDDIRERYISEVKRHASMTFDAFLHELLDRHDSVDIHAAFHEHMDLYVHQETLNADFTAVCAYCSLPSDIHVQTLNATDALGEGQSYRDYYTPTMVEYVYRKCRPFFERFPEYSFEGIDEAMAKARRPHAATMQGRPAALQLAATRRSS